MSRCEAQLPTQNALNLDELYQKEIRQLELLTFEQEQMLGRAISEGVAARTTLANNGLSSPEEKNNLKRRIETGLQSRSALAESNLRLVVTIANKYQHRGVSVSELIEEGNIGLLVAVDKFDYRKGNRFSTCAFPWIRQSIIRAVLKSRLLRPSVHIVEDYITSARAKQELTTKLGREPSWEEVSEKTGIEIRKLERIQDIGESIVSLDALVDEPDGDCFGDFIDSGWPSAGKLAETRIQLEEVFDASFDVLTIEQKRVLVLRGIYSLTLEEIGRIIGLTRQKVALVQNKAIARLVKNGILSKKEAENFKEYINQK